jgi:hypothetical protein
VLASIKRLEVEQLVRAEQPQVGVGDRPGREAQAHAKPQVGGGGAQLDLPRRELRIDRVVDAAQAPLRAGAQPGAVAVDQRLLARAGQGRRGAPGQRVRVGPRDPQRPAAARVHVDLAVAVARGHQQVQRRPGDLDGEARRAGLGDEVTHLRVAPLEQQQALEQQARGGRVGSRHEQRLVDQWFAGQSQRPQGLEQARGAAPAPGPPQPCFADQRRDQQ